MTSWLTLAYSQGPYSGEGDIVVLCAYLGQLARMRDALANKVAVVIDERDQRELADREAEHEDTMAQPVIEHVKVSRRVSWDRSTGTAAADKCTGPFANYR